MLLAQDGRLALADPVSSYVREFDSEDKRDITILQLLTHTSGLPAYTSAALVEEHNGPRPNPDGLINHIGTLPKKYETGKGYTYSCLNYLVLARVVQNVTGRNMEAFLRERLWRPLEINDTTFYPDAAQNPRVAPTVYRDGVLRRGEVHDPLAYYSASPDYAPGNAGCFSTVDDTAHYVQMLLNGGRWKRTRIFTREIWTRLTTDQTGELKADRTCGWAVAARGEYITPRNRTPDTCCLIHTGYTGTMIWMDKLSKTYIILFSNCVYPNDDAKDKTALIEARRAIVRTVLDHLDVYRKLRRKTVRE
jgi:CubicO group peptidase (beta-lactamase class C family)